MICTCGKKTETRIGILGIGFIHGCWDKAHDFVVIHNEDYKNPQVIGVIEDTIPHTGIECQTEAEAIKSYEAFHA
jgi:hypothetical protein